ncbi:hypothetical protein FACS1894113_1320 [Alphaproteobacteria bacterium]|nr:hypothetical protein FACS1894113_1320 [Alphaproteobacteria bacterium]
MNSIIEKRTSHIEKCNSEIESLDNNIKELSKDLALIQENARKKSSEIIDSAIKKASETIVKQEQALKNENDALIAETRSQLDEEMENLQSIIKEQVNTTAQIVLEKLLRS